MKDYESQNEKKPEVDENYVLPRPLRVGDEVLLVNIDKTGTVTEISGNNIVVQTGLIKTKTKLSNLRLVDAPVIITADKKKQTAKSYISSIDRSCSSEIDLRGKTGDEAWPLVDRYIDKASMAGLNSVRLVHGKGTGALKNYLWGMLRNDTRVKSYRIGVHGEGDGGVTVVTLK